MTANYKQIAQAITELMKSGESEENLVKSIAQYLSAERRTGELDKIMREVERLRLVNEDILEVEVFSAKGISAQIEQEIARLFSSSKVNVVKSIDRDLVGGVRIRTLDEQLDLSVRGRLKKLTNSMRY